ncbi:YfgG family protein [Serratia ureilytica]
MRKKTTGQMTKIVLFISFIILVGRLLYAAVVAVPHHQESRPLRKRRRSQRTATGRLL